MIDLHMHTKYSDGADTVIELLKKAEGKRLEIISITDHDEVSAHIELQNIEVEKYFTGRIVPGIEIRATYKGIIIEILGYGIDIQRIKNSKYIVSEVKEGKQEEHLENMKKIGRDIGLKFDESICTSETKVFASKVFGDEIFKHEGNKDIIEKYRLGANGSDFYRNGESNPDSIFYIENGLSEIKIIINEIHEAGGLAFMAHPFLYSFEDKLKTIEEILRNTNIDGLECYYYSFSEEQTKQLVDLCIKYNKYKSGGSDYHREGNLNRQMGIGRGNLNITYELVKDWIDKL